jgi:hypothetical protein
MRPIDTIRTSIDSDLVKYHGATLCQIEREEHIKMIRGIGLCAIVHPFDKLDPGNPLMTGLDSSFPVIVVNRTKGWWETNFHKKYLIMIMSPVADKPTAALGYAVPISILRDLEVFKNEVDNETVKDTTGKSIESKTKETSSNGSTA